MAIIDIASILAPIPGDDPAGEDLRYTATHEELKEARRADDLLDRGDWKRDDIKTADWNKIIAIATEALRSKTKDLQIAAFLVEALTHTEGFAGVAIGLDIITGLLQKFWEHFYPRIEEGDLEYRIGPLEFLNEKLWLPIKQIPVTDRTPSGYSWMQWQESRQVGAEKDTRNQNGDVDENKQRAREALIAEGKLTAEEFDKAVSLSSKAFYQTLAENVTACIEAFKRLDETVDKKFGREAPRLTELKTSLEDCELLVSKILKEKRTLEPDPVTEALQAPPATAPETTSSEEIFDAETPHEISSPAARGGPRVSDGAYRVNRLLGSTGMEEAVWQDALSKFKTAGIKEALEQLLGASCCAQSVREKTNFRLLMAKLCLKAGRHDLARPMAESLNALVDELHLAQWESPIWIAEVLAALYQCLTAEGASDEDLQRARELMTRLCTLDVTKALEHTR
ncbi:MAG: type VI secretion system protein TssA [Deltaproteobacteria bacterium]|nr:type VI secretion system protein TssA [Deltaproteobacteria bacterium]